MADEVKKQVGMLHWGVSPKFSWLIGGFLLGAGLVLLLITLWVNFRI